MTIQELIDQLLAECERNGFDPAETPALVDFGCDCDLGEVETVDTRDGQILIY